MVSGYSKSNQDSCLELYVGARVIVFKYEHVSDNSYLEAINRGFLAEDNVKESKL